MVDDDPHYRTFARDFISRIRPDIAMVDFPNGLAALEFLAQNPADLLIPDYQMPDMNGLQLADAARSVYPNGPILLVSGDDIETEAIAHEAGALVAKRSFMTDLNHAIQRLGIRARAQL